MSKLAEGALFAIGTEYPFPEAPLVKPLSHDGRDVGSPDVVCCRYDGLISHQSHRGVIDGYLEGKCCGIVAYNIDGPCCQVPAWNEAMEIDERRTLRHRLPETEVVSVKGIGTPVLIQQITVLAETISVGTLWCCCYREGKIKMAGFEDALWSEQGDPFTLELESFLKKRPRQNVSVNGCLFFEPFKCPESNCLINPGHVVSESLIARIMLEKPSHCATAGNLYWGDRLRPTAKQPAGSRGACSSPFRFHTLP